ncbi:M48 family metallopeptidase [Candidatus Cloacimonadota bacterium]
METIEIDYGGTNFSIEIIRKQIKNVYLKVYPDGTIKISANYEVSYDFLKNYIVEKRYWIYKKLRAFQDFSIEVSTKSYVSGEAVRYLGKQYRLKIFEDKMDNVKWFRGYIHIYTKKVDNTKYKQKLYEEWLRKKAHQITIEIINDELNKLSRFNIHRPEITLRKMKSRWGSYIPKNNSVTLNTELIKTPKQCIEYVIVHELLHLIFPNHSKDFYNLLAIKMPDWKQRKKILDEEFGRITL